MFDMLLVSEAMRFPYKKYTWQQRFLTARIYLIDWARKKVIKTISPPRAYFIEEFTSLKHCYHYHGARGITSNGKYIFIALQNTIEVYDYELNHVTTIHNPLFNGLHELDWYKNTLYVTCAVTDTIVALKETGEVKQNFFLGNSAYFNKKFELVPRNLDRSLDYRIIHKCKRLYHINNVYVSDEGIFAGLRKQGAFVKIYPHEEIIIHDEKLKGCHNAQYTPDGKYILINDTNNYSVQVFGSNRNHIRTIDVRKFSLPIDFTQRRTFGEEKHEIWAGWLRGMEFSSKDRHLVFLGLSPTCIIAVNYLTGELHDSLQFRKNIWITVHGLHNLSLKPP